MHFIKLSSYMKIIRSRFKIVVAMTKFCYPIHDRPLIHWFHNQYKVLPKATFDILDWKNK